MKHFSLLLLTVLSFAGVLNAQGYPPQISPLPCQGCSVHYEVQAELLYWVPEVSGLDTNFGSGSSSLFGLDGVTTTTSRETDVDPSFDWDVGYRLALGLQFDDSRFEMGALWTDFHGSGHKGTNHGDWKVKLNQMDVAGLYKYSFNSCVTLRPFIGLRGTSIRQKLFSQINTAVLFPTLGTAIDTRTLQDRQQFNAVGPLLGLNADWDINYGFGLYGSIGGSLLYGKHKLRFNDSEVITPPATPGQIFSRIRKDLKAFDFNVDLALGIQWQYLFQNAYCLTMKLGLENHQYFNQSRLGKSFGNLSFSGGTFYLGLSF